MKGRTNCHDVFFLLMSVGVIEASPMRNKVPIEWMSYKSPTDCNSPRVIPACRIIINKHKNHKKKMKMKHRTYEMKVLYLFNYIARSFKTLNYNSKVRTVRM